MFSFVTFVDDVMYIHTFFYFLEYQDLSLNYCNYLWYYERNNCFLLCWCFMIRTYSFHSGLCIPANNTIFIKSISEKLAEKEPHLTLEFLEECIQGFGNSNIEMKHLCLEYITPWLPNLTRYVRTFVLNIEL